MVIVPTNRVAPDEMTVLSQVISTVKPLIVLESGTGFGGGSTTVIGRTLRANGSGMLYTYEAHKPFYDVAVEHIKQMGLSAFVTLMNEDIVKAASNFDDAFFNNVKVVFLDGGDENPDGSAKRNMDEYYKNLDLSENVASFKILEKKLRPGTHVLLHDWVCTVGRGYLVQLYLKSINYAGWKLERVVSHTETGMGYLIKL